MYLDLALRLLVHLGVRRVHLLILLVHYVRQIRRPFVRVRRYETPFQLAKLNLLLQFLVANPV